MSATDPKGTNMLTKRQAAGIAEALTDNPDAGWTGQLVSAEIVCHGDSDDVTLTSEVLQDDEDATRTFVLRLTAEGDAVESFEVQ